MEIVPIKTEADYEAALRKVEALWDADPGAPEGDMLELLTTLIERYEAKRYAIPLPDPIEALKFYMESRGLTRRDMEPYLGNRGRVAEILNRRRPLTIAMVRRLHEELGMPADVLIKKYELAPDRRRSPAAASH
jgi:HTH-type transcriptional regulator/antitoxin HigA